MLRSTAEGYRADIDGLRAVAVVSILFFHAGFAAFSGGFVGVDVFFVISGYLITQLIRREIEATGTFQFGNFYARRARRLFPALIATLTASFILSFLLLAPERFRDFAGSLVYAVASLSNFYFWSSAGYFDTDGLFKPLLHTWSLSVEEQFYLVWPALIVLLLTRWRSTPTLLALLALAGSSFILNEAFHFEPATIFYLAPFRVFEFAIGAAVTWLDKRQLSPLTSEAVLAAGLSLIAYAVFAFNDSTRIPSYNALIPCIGAAMAIYGGRAPYTGRLLRNPLSVAIGLVSYSLYLVHWPLIVFYRYATFTEPTVAEKWALCGLAATLAACMYRYIEQPFRRPSGITYANSAFGLACAGLAFAIVLPASTTWANGGWLWRANIPPGDIAEFVKFGGGEGQFHDNHYGGVNCIGAKRRECEFENGPEKFVLIGDSHGRMYYEGLMEFASSRKFGFKVFEAGACNFISPLSVCPAKEKAAAYVQNNRTEIIVLSHSWMRGNYETLFFKRSKGQLLLEPAEFSDYYAKELKALITNGYLAGVKKIVLIGAVPQFAGHGDAVDCLTRPEFLVARPRCDVGVIALHPRLEKYREFNKLFGTAVRQFAIPGKEIRFFDPFDALCDDRVCRQIVRDKLIYSDDDHLSKYGATVAIKHFAKQLQDFLIDDKTLSTSSDEAP
ncbi:acyltransferase family protein [Hyphomicrobium sp.]|uniref:acyltransferase family protein n=1 Tax=Hyphomicrobium sp. TaxID=82 RepID=UPI003F71B07B